MNRIVFIAWLLTLAASAKAALIFTPSTETQVAAPGAELIFAGTLANTSPTEKIFLNEITASISGSVALKTSTFFANVPGILLPGETYTGPLFSVKLNNGVPAADYSVSVTIQGGAAIDAATDLASAPITVLATPISQWRYQTFGAAANDPAASDLADWDHDGAANLAEYALGTDAKVPGTPPPVMIVSDHLTLSYMPNAADVSYIVEGSTDLLQWSTGNVELVTPGLPGVVTYRFAQPMSLGGAAFMRVGVHR